MYCICEPNLHDCQEEIGTNPFDKTFSVSAQFFQFSNLLRMSGESLTIHKASQFAQSWSEPLQKAYFLPLNTFCCWFTSAVWIVFLLRHSTSVELQLALYFLPNVLINLGIQFSIDGNKLSKPWGNKTLPNHDGLSTILYSREEVLMLVYSVLCLFSPHITLCVFFPKQLNFG